MNDLTRRKKGILIVDDSPDVRRSLRQILVEQPDWEVWGEAENGKEAIQKAEYLRPDIVILDLSMPVMNGLDAAREIRKMLPSSQLFLFSAFHTENLAEMARSAGIDAYVPKSQIQNLLSQISQCAAA
jgi:DNA-binding NarL/FixJ family response regulator